ncbi:hypothetical protein LK494_03075 [Anaerovorax odorimutans]|nr:hypothetical protein [Anaerovorax odorimutans]
MIRVLKLGHEMKLYRYSTVAGRTLMRRFVASTRIKTEKGQKRKEKANPTPEAVRKINLKNAIWTLCVLLNTYFKKGDQHIVLTYASEPGKKTAKKDLDKLIRNLREHHKGTGCSFKWIAVTEYSHKRIHHHLVCSRTELEILEKYWPHGWVTPKSLDATGNYIKLAEYLIKETEKTFRDDDSPNKVRYRRSRNMPMPAAQREEVSDKELKNGPKEIDGYYIDQDTVHKYEHAILGVECMQYIMVSLDKEPRLKRWYRGKVVKLEGEYKVQGEKQLTFDELVCDAEGAEL